MPSSHRPAIVTLLGLGVLTLAAVFLVRLAAGLRPPPFPNSIPGWYLPLTGAVWGIGGSALAYGLLSGRRWAPALARLAALGFTAWYWVDRLFLTRSDYATLSRPADAMVNIIALVFLIWGLNRDGTRDYFGESAS